MDLDTSRVDCDAHWVVGPDESLVDLELVQSPVYVRVVWNLQPPHVLGEEVDEFPCLPVGLVEEQPDEGEEPDVGFWIAVGLANLPIISRILCDPPSHQTLGFARPGEVVGWIGTGGAKAAGGRIELKTKATDPFRVVGSLQVFLRSMKGLESTQPSENWLARHIEEPHEEMESLMARDFFDRIEDFQRTLGITETLLVMIDGKTVFDIGPDPPTKLDNLREVNERILMNFLSINQNAMKDIHLESYGQRDPLKIHLTIRFRQKHPVDDSALTLGFFAIPKELWEEKDESEFFYEDRVNEIIADKESTHEILRRRAVRRCSLFLRMRRWN